MSKEFEALIGQYWDLAYLEGKSGISQGDKANEVLFALRNLAEQPAQQEPIYQCQDSEGKWTDQAKHSYDYNAKHGSAKVRVVYTTPQAQPAQQELCTWSKPDSDHMPDTYQASCGAMWTFTDGGPKDNDMHFCPKCGKHLTEKEHE